MYPLLLVLWLGFSCAAQAAPDWTEVESSAMDSTQLTHRAQAILQDPAFKWHHAQTGRFVLHFEHGIFAAKVARMADSFYRYIGGDMPGLRDGQAGRSHIFIFRNPKQWDVLRRSFPNGPGEWAFSFVEGPVMYLQQADNTSDSADVLGHEMTHLVLNRFIAEPLPLWLHEGLAEWYGTFAYAEYKGVKKSRRAQFPPLPSPYSVGELLSLSGYPADPAAIQRFYASSKYLIGYLRLERAPDRFVPFVLDVAAGMDGAGALIKAYGMTGQDEVERGFARFVR